MNVTWLCSFPKTGRTWVRWFYVQYINALFEMGWQTTFDLMWLNEIAPPNWLLLRGEKIPDQWQDKPYLLVSRENVDGTPKVMLVRNPADTLISLYHHKKQKGSLDDFVLAHLPDYISYYANAKADLFLTYEGLWLDQGFDELIRFMGLPIDEHAMDDALLASQFGTMREAERRGKEPPCGWRIRSGGVGGYWKTLQPATIRRIKEVCWDLPAYQMTIMGHT